MVVKGEVGNKIWQGNREDPVVGEAALLVVGVTRWRKEKALWVGERALVTGGLGGGEKINGD